MGFKPTQKKMETPLKIASVGNGVQQCIWQANIPVAIPGENGESHLYELETPLVGETGAHVPIIIVLRTMSAKTGVLEMGRDMERLTFPGPGGYSINWAPGAVHMPLQRAMSGHLMAPLTAYDKLPKTGGVKQEGVPTLHAVVHDDNDEPISQNDNGNTSTGN